MDLIRRFERKIEKILRGLGLGGGLGNLLLALFGDALLGLLGLAAGTLFLHQRRHFEIGDLVVVLQTLGILQLHSNFRGVV